MSQSAPKVDAIVLAGTHIDKKKLIRGHNKAFLPVGDGISLGLVLDALRRSSKVGGIFVVGPEPALRHLLPPEEQGYRIVTEKGRMLDNAWSAFTAAEDSLSPDTLAEERRDRAYLFLTSDIPLAVPEAIDDFLERCFALEKERGGTVDFFAGLADEVALAPFYPKPSRHGIRRPYLELKHQRLRLANIYLARPRRIKNLEILQQGFAARKLTQWRSIGRLIAAFLRNPGGIRGALHILCFQAAALLERGGAHRLASLPRGFLRLPVVERTASMMLGCQFVSVITPYGGLSVDIDDDSDYEIIRENLGVWREHQRTLMPSLARRPRLATISPAARIGRAAPGRPVKPDPPPRDPPFQRPPDVSDD